MPIGLVIINIFIIITAGIIIGIAARGILQWVWNNNSPKNRAQVHVVTKRMFAQNGSYTSYYIEKRLYE